MSEQDYLISKMNPPRTLRAILAEGRRTSRQTGMIAGPELKKYRRAMNQGKLKQARELWLAGKEGGPEAQRAVNLASLERGATVLSPARGDMVRARTQLMMSRLDGYQRSSGLGLK